MVSHKAFVVGARGYIGARLYARLKEQMACSGTSSSGGGEYMRLQLGAPDEFSYESITSGDVVCLAAAISAPDVCARDHARAWAVNVEGTSEFIKRVIDRKARVIFFSSDTVYGERMEAFSEDADCKPAGEYAEMKSAVERRFLGESGFKTIRISYVFSKEDKFTKYLSGSASNGKEVELFHPFNRAVIHREDVVDAVVALVRDWDTFPESIINFGGPEVVSRIQFADVLRDCGLTGLKTRVTEPSADFFLNRPRVIQMTSLVLPRLLGRPARTLAEAAKIELCPKESRDL